VFGDAKDLNYQRILAYLYGAKTVSTPIDFAFFARRINPILNDPSATGANSLQTCADLSCHGVSVVGQPAPNGSNFPLIPNASDKQSLLVNFASAANFTNFLNARGSSLYLYPTNEVANIANPFATGLPHPGGLNFSPDSQFAKDVLRWAGGLRPDAQGRQRNWLVGGDFSAQLISDSTPVDEVNVTPAIFDRSGAPQFNNGQWDGFFSDDVGGTVDLNVAFPRAQTAGRVAYAVAYLINTTPNDLQVQLDFFTPNAIKVYVGNQPVLQTNDARSGQSTIALVPSNTSGKSSTRILVKLLQRAGDRDFKFRVNLHDLFGNVLTDSSGEIVVKLSPNGGI
jgi:hypothetical protein